MYLKGGIKDGSTKEDAKVFMSGGLAVVIGKDGKLEAIYGAEPIAPFGSERGLKEKEGREEVRRTGFCGPL